MEIARRSEFSASVLNRLVQGICTAGRVRPMSRRRDMSNVTSFRMMIDGEAIPTCLNGMLNSQFSY